MQTTAIETEYVMTLHSPGGGPPHRVDDSLFIYRQGRADGTVEGPRIKGAIIQPTGDWLRVMPAGCFRVDARMTIRTDDGAIIHASYGGVIRVSPDNFQRMAKGGTLTAADMYFVTTPVFQTSHERYAWLNDVQAIGKVAAVKGGDEGFVRYDVFAVR